eukprot:gene11371-13253_t
MYLKVSTPNSFFLLLRHGDLDLIRYLTQIDEANEYGIQFSIEEFTDFINYLVQLADLTVLPDYLDIIQYIAGRYLKYYNLPSNNDIINSFSGSLLERLGHPQICYLVLLTISDKLDILYDVLSHPKYIVQTLLGFNYDEFTVPTLLNRVQSTVALSFDLICKYGTLAQVQLAHHLVIINKGFYSHRSVEKATNPEIIEYLCMSNLVSAESYPVIIDKAFARGDINTLRYFKNAKQFEPRSQPIAMAIKGCNVEAFFLAFQHLRQKAVNDKFLSLEEFDRLLRVGGRDFVTRLLAYPLESIEYIMSSAHPLQLNLFLLSSAIRVGNLDIIKLLDHVFNEPITNLVLDDALDHPSRDVFDYLVANRTEGFGHKAFKIAGSRGDL